MIKETIGHITKEGNEYIIELEQFIDIPINILKNITIVDVALKPISMSGKNSVKDLSDIGKYLVDFLDDHPDVLLYYYCDKSPIARSLRNQTISPEKYRFKLFNCLFQKIRREDFWQENLEITEQEEHYLSIIGGKNLDPFRPVLQKELQRLRTK